MPHSFMPLQQHPAEVRRVLLKAWMHCQAIRVAERRQDFKHLQPGFDRWATLQIFHSQQLDECHKGALRAVIMGNIVTQKTASRWTGVVTCPHCQEEVEDRWHRFYVCPAWAQQRMVPLHLQVSLAEAKADLDDGT